MLQPVLYVTNVWEFPFEIQNVYLGYNSNSKSNVLVKTRENITNFVFDFSISAFSATIKTFTTQSFTPISINSDVWIGKKSELSFVDNLDCSGSCSCQSTEF